MASDQAHSSDEINAVRKQTQQASIQVDQNPPGQQPPIEPVYPTRLLAHPSIGRSSNAPVRAAVIQRMQQNAGNKQARKAVQRFSGPSLAQRPGGPYTPYVPTDEERESRKSDSMWEELYEEYEDMRPKAQSDDEYTKTLEKAQYDLDNPAF